MKLLVFTGHNLIGSINVPNASAGQKIQNIIQVSPSFGEATSLFSSSFADNYIVQTYNADLSANTYVALVSDPA